MQITQLAWINPKAGEVCLQHQFGNFYSPDNYNKKSRKDEAINKFLFFRIHINFDLIPVAHEYNDREKKLFLACPILLISKDQLKEFII
jgi:hypothetical protein